MRYFLGIVLRVIVVFLPIEFSEADGNPCGDYSKSPLNKITILLANGIGNEASDACYSSPILRINGK